MQKGSADKKKRKVLERDLYVKLVYVAGQVTETCSEI